ncbi:OmpA family protein [Novosphingobium lentum]|uniref:OmpA family protein n=1 Tax=Novosphingobium lentum TaxID=145287 RepID=UPI00082AA0C4|nr:OmpA family protein [Novosphingobium lentum]
MTPGTKHGIGVAAALAVAFASHVATGPRLAVSLERGARTALARAGGEGVTADFTTIGGLYTRHPRLSTARELTEGERSRLARAVAHVPGVGAVTWASAPGLLQARATPHAAIAPDHCQKDVEGLLRVRTIRFAEGSAGIDPASSELIDEVTTALLPCAGNRIAISGHTDAMGDEPANLALSQRRAQAVRDELVRRGLLPDQLVARGFGSSQPLAGTSPQDPANRRIEFSVIAVAPLRPTPVDTPVAQ